MMLQNVRLSFPQLFTAASFSPEQKKKFSATLLFDADGAIHGQVKKATVEAAEAKWPGKGAAMVKQLAAQGKLALRNGAEKPNYDGFGDGVMFVNASNDKRPTVIDRDRTPLTEEDGRVYAGCYVNAMVEFWAQDNQFGKRVNCSLRGVQFVSDGEPFGGGGVPATADDFPELEDSSAPQTDAVDTGWDDDDPFAT